VQLITDPASFLGKPGRLEGYRRMTPGQRFSAPGPGREGSGMSILVEAKRLFELDGFHRASF
jgi:hypothetical protein